MTAAVLIPVGESMTLVDVVADDPQAMAQAIGCDWIAIVGVGIDGLRLVVDDEGLLTRRPPNFRASFLAERMLVGDALLIGVDLDGSTIDIPQYVIDELLAGAGS